MHGARQGDRAKASLASSTRFIEFDAFVWSNNSVRVLARNGSGGAFDLAEFGELVHDAANRDFRVIVPPDRTHPTFVSPVDDYRHDQAQGVDHDDQIA